MIDKIVAKDKGDYMIRQLRHFQLEDGYGKGGVVPDKDR